MKNTQIQEQEDLVNGKNLATQGNQVYKQVNYSKKSL